MRNIKQPTATARGMRVKCVTFLLLLLEFVRIWKSTHKYTKEEANEKKAHGLKFLLLQKATELKCHKSSE